MNVIHPLMLFLCALGCICFLIQGQWTPAAWPAIAAIWVWMHRGEQRMSEKWRSRA